MKISANWKIPAALGMIICSLTPILLLSLIDAIDTSNSEWSSKHLKLPVIADNFLACHRIGFALPALTTFFAAWFAFGKPAEPVRLAWIALLLVVAHLFWLSWGILAFYLTNQKFVLY